MQSAKRPRDEGEGDAPSKLARTGDGGAGAGGSGSSKPVAADDGDERSARLFIGNLDNKVTE